jgi:hypothetical protein
MDRPSSSERQEIYQLYTAAVDSIHSTQLTAVEHRMLVAFLGHAVSKRKACQFILDQVSQAPLKGLSPEQVLRSIK